MSVTHFLGNNNEDKEQYIKTLKRYNRIIGTLELSAYTRLPGIEGLVFSLDKDAKPEDIQMLKYIAKNQLHINDWSDKYYDLSSKESKSGAALQGDQIIIYDPKKIEPIMKKLINNGEFCVIVGKSIGNTVLTGTYTENHTKAIFDFLSKSINQFPYFERKSYVEEYGKDLDSISSYLNEPSKNK